MYYLFLLFSVYVCIYVSFQFVYIYITTYTYMECTHTYMYVYNQTYLYIYVCIHNSLSICSFLKIRCQIRLTNPIIKVHSPVYWGHYIVKNFKQNSQYAVGSLVSKMLWLASTSAHVIKYLRSTGCCPLVPIRKATMLPKSAPINVSVRRHSFTVLFNNNYNEERDFFEKKNLYRHRWKLLHRIAIFFFITVLL